MHTPMSYPATEFAPRDYTTGAGLPSDRIAHQAARQAFATLKLTFIQALDDLQGADWLRELIRSAEEPVDLWLLRAPVFAALASAEPQYRGRRQMLRRGLDSMFPDLEPASGFMPL